MAAIDVTISGVLYDKQRRTTQQVVLIGEASLTGVGIGGGPLPGGPGEGPGDPPGIWGGGNVPMPNPPIANVPGAPGYRPPGDGIWGPNDPRPNPPIAFPPGWVGGVPPLPPGITPPEPPAPGSPTTPIPGNWPVTGIVPPTYMLVYWPGIGPVVVSPPVQPDQAPPA